MTDELDYDKLHAEASKNLDAVKGTVDNLHFFENVWTVVGSGQTRVRKYLWLQELTTSLSKAVSPLTACKNECNHCCKQSVAVSELDARAIAAMTGRSYVKPVFTQSEEALEAQRAKYMNVPCPFLVDERCSVYAVRPLVCRIHFNMSDTPEACDTGKYPEQRVPLMNMNGFYPPMANVVGDGFADIRDWFPKE